MLFNKAEKLVNIVAMKAALINHLSEFPTHEMSRDNIYEIADEFVQLSIEMPLAEHAGWAHGDADIYDIVNNVDEMRDCMDSIVDDLSDDDNKKFFARLDKTFGSASVSPVDELSDKNHEKTIQHFLAPIRKMHCYGHNAVEALDELDQDEQATFFTLLNKIAANMPCVSVCPPVEYIHLIQYALDRNMIIRISWNDENDTDYFSDYNEIIDHVEKHETCIIYIKNPKSKDRPCGDWFDLHPYDRDVIRTVVAHSVSDFTNQWGADYRSLLSESQKNDH